MNFFIDKAVNVWTTALYHQQDSLLLHVPTQPIKIHYLILHRIQIGDTSLTLHEAHREPTMAVDPYSVIPLDIACLAGK